MPASATAAPRRTMTDGVSPASTLGPLRRARPDMCAGAGADSRDVERGRCAGLVALPRAQRQRALDRHQGADRLRSRQEHALAAGPATGPLLADPARRPHLPHRVPGRRAGDDGDRSSDRARSCGSARRRRSRPASIDKRNNAASPSPAVEGDGVYVFFPDYGLVAYDAAGTERWTMPLGPFNNIYGMGASPIIVGDLLVLACDQSLGSFLMALDKRTGTVRWKVDRPEAKSGHSTPDRVAAVPDGRDQILLPGSFLLTALRRRDGPEAVVGRRAVVRDEVDAGDWRRHHLRERLRRAGQRPGQQDHRSRRPTRCGRRRTPTATARSRSPSSRSSPQAFWFDVADLDANGSLTQGRVGLLPRGARLGERHARDPPRRLGRHERQVDPLEVPAHVPQLPSPLLYRRRARTW